MANRRFSAADRVKILRLVPNKPTGVIFEFGDMEFDLISVPTGKMIEILDTLNTVSSLDRQPGESIIAAIGTHGRKLIDIAHDLLFQSAFYGIDDPKKEDVAVFDEWFASLPPLPLLKEIAPKLLQAAGVSGVQQNPSKPTADPETPTPATSTPSMQLV